jgi:GrpB-like predicted nucleotidyltransferase (UPF0157 family)
MTGSVRLVPYDSTWPLEFAAEAERIERACEGMPLRLEHIGSTSIPGLAAKPVIDILAGRPGNVAGNKYVDALRQIGYEHKGAYGIPGRNYFRRGTPRTHHVHMVSWSSDLWRDHLLFRDYLRLHPRLLVSTRRSSVSSRLLISTTRSSTRTPRDRSCARSCDVPARKGSHRARADAKTSGARA